MLLPAGILHSGASQSFQSLGRGFGFLEVPPPHAGTGIRNGNYCGLGQGIPKG